MHLDGAQYVAICVRSIQLQKYYATDLKFPLLVTINVHYEIRSTELKFPVIHHNHDALWNMHKRSITDLTAKLVIKLKYG